MCLRISLLALIFLIILASLTTSIITGEDSVNDLFKRVSMSIFFDVSDNIGYVEENITLKQTINETYVLLVPLIPPTKNDSKYAVLDVRSGDNHLLYSINREENTLKIIVNNTSNITIEYMLYNYMEEVGVGLYTLFLDLSVYNNIASDLMVRVSFLNTYDVEVYPKMGTKTSYNDKYVVIHISRPYAYTFVITERSLGELTTHATQTTGGGTENISKGLNYYYLAIILAIIIVAILLFLLIRRKTTRVEVETIPATDLLSDETVREIILIVGKHSEEGIKQSELVRKTNKPKSTISRRVNRLAREGIVEIIRKGKYNIIKLSPKGMQLYRKLLEEKEK